METRCGRGRVRRPGPTPTCSATSGKARAQVARVGDMWQAEIRRAARVHQCSSGGTAMPDNIIVTSKYGCGSIEVWNETVGPFYDDARVCALLEINDDVLGHLVRDRVILALPTADGYFLYPTRQFSRRSILSGWPDVLRAISAAGGSPWVIAVWAATPDSDSPLGNLSPWQWLSDRRDVQPLLEEIKDLAWRWSQ